jgi:CubicO group peptidase (beta-lactamase class C family)
MIEKKVSNPRGLILLAFALMSSVLMAAEKPIAYWYRGHMMFVKNKEPFYPNQAFVRELKTLEATSLKEPIKSAANRTLSNDNRLALLLIEKGNVVFEGYNNGSAPYYTHLSASIAKSMTSLAVGEAICRGKIGSVNDSVEKYLPEFTGNNYGSAKLVDLLHMASGITGDTGKDVPYDDLYKTFGYEVWEQQTKMMDVAMAYGNPNKGNFDAQKRGKFFDYKNINVVILAKVVATATGKTFPQWFGETVGATAGIKNTIYWGLDKNNDAVSYGFFSATVTDYGRIALYVLDGLNGKHGDCIKTYLHDAVTDVITEGTRFGNAYGHTSYGYLFRTDLIGSPKRAFKMQGAGGQHIIFDPVGERIVLGFSHKWDDDIQSLFNLWANEP